MENTRALADSFDTARKHGRNAFAVLHELMTGNPWRPPAAAFSPVTTTGTRVAG